VVKIKYNSDQRFMFYRCEHCDGDYVFLCEAENCEKSHKDVDQMDAMLKRIESLESDVRILQHQLLTLASASYPITGKINLMGYNL